MRGSIRTGMTGVERTLLIIGVVCLGYYAYDTVEARRVQREQTAAFELVLEQRGAEKTRRNLPGDVPVATPGKNAAVAPSEGRSTTGRDVIALIDIPRLNVSSPIMSGDSEAVLDVAIGHLPDTPKPWQPGNSAIAAHRDGLFRPLRRIRIGDEVRIRSTAGDLLYRVRETKVVEPDDLSVLAPTEQSTLTLITCYPFNFIGNAPQRFIVHAERIESVTSGQ